MNWNRIDRYQLGESRLGPAENKARANTDNAQIIDATSFYRQAGISDRSCSSQPDDPHSANTVDLDFIDFLAIAQWRQIDFFPITWQQTLSFIGIGGTARVRQSLVRSEVSLAFKQLHLEKATASGKTAALRACMNEVSILGHPIIRRHPNIIRLEGICWDLTGNEIWPVLVFRKATHGNLRHFLLSNAGKSLTVWQRLEICSGIASALMTMHAFHIIHGDLKPENVLIFEDENGRHTARVVDFGYSGLSLHRVEDSEFHLPISRPWSSPELHEWSSKLLFSAARSSDMYSFGMVSIWVLFCNHLTASANLGGDLCADADLHLLQTLKDNDLLFAFAMQCAEHEDLTKEQISGLVLLFSWTLATDSTARQLPEECYETAQKIFLEQRHAVSFAAGPGEIAADLKPATLTSLGIMYTDIEGHQRPFGFLHYYSTKQDLGYNTDHSTFRLGDEIPALVVSDYRLWIFLRHCYEARYNDNGGEASSKSDAAFHLALLSELGLLIPNETGEKSNWLFRSGRSKTDLDSEIDKIRKVSHLSYRDLDIPLDLIDHVEQYGECGLLEEAQKIYGSTADHLQLLLGATHPLVIRLRIVNAKALQRMGNLLDAESVLINQINANETAQLSETREAVAATTHLVSVYIDRSQWRKAEDLQLRVLRTSTRVWGEESSEALTSMGNLAVIHWNLLDFDKAEEISSRQLRILEKSHGRRHKKTLAAMNNLASTYEYQGRSEDAARMKLEALAISTDINGKDHEYTLILMNNVANNYRKRKMFSDAEKLDVELVQARKRHFGDDHLATLVAMANLASSYALQKRPEEAEPLERHVAGTFVAQLGPRHPHALTAHHNLAKTLTDLGHKIKAIEMMTDVVAGRIEVLGPQHPETKKSAQNLQLWQDMAESNTKNL